MKATPRYARLLRRRAGGTKAITPKIFDKSWRIGMFFSKSSFGMRRILACPSSTTPFHNKISHTRKSHCRDQTAWLGVRGLELKNESLSRV
jgi:hypothetical protein